MNWQAVTTYALVSFASFVAGAWFALVLLRRETATRRGGYVKPPASAGTNQTTVRLAPTSTSLSPRPGRVSAVAAGPETLSEWSRRVGPSFSGNAPDIHGEMIGRTPPESAAPARRFNICPVCGEKMAWNVLEGKWVGCQDGVTDHAPAARLDHIDRALQRTDDLAWKIAEELRLRHEEEIRQGKWRRGDDAA